MVRVQACKACGVALEMNARIKNDGSKLSIPLLKCPLCRGVLVDDDSENYYEE